MDKDLQWNRLKILDNILETTTVSFLSEHIDIEPNLQDQCLKEFYMWVKQRLHEEYKNFDLK